MPELPSVEIFKRYFDKCALRQMIKKVEVKSPELVVNLSSRELEKSLECHEFISSSRYGKYLFSYLSNGLYLVMHFGMTGYLHYFHQHSSKHVRMLITFKNGYHLAFDDARKFGKLGITKDPDKFVKMKKLGPDALKVDFKNFKNLFKGRKGMIKPLLMNQQVIAGIGNLYADEILYQSRVHPMTPANHLDEEKWEMIFYEMKRVLKKAIECNDKIQALPSNYILSHREINGKCPDGQDLEIIKVGGRTTYLCPDKQK